MASARFLFSTYRSYLVLMVLLLPMFFIGIRDTHDWGDDFAIYIQGALNITQHKPVSETKYVSFENYNHKYPPAAVPVGYPLILSPVIEMFGLDYKVLNYYMSFWLYLLAITVFVFLRRYISMLSALCLTLIFFLNPFMIAFKSEVISDLPFAFFSTLILLIYMRRESDAKLLSQISLGILIAMLVSIRSIGWCTVLCLGFDLFIRFVSSRREGDPIAVSLRFFIERCKWVLSFVGTYAVLSFIAGHSRGNSFSFYTSSYQGIHVWEVLMANLTIYIQDFQGLFEHDAGIYGFGLLITKAAMLFCFVLGLIYTISNGYNILLIYFLLYAIAVLLSPFSTQGFRLFFPLYPIILLYIAYGARSISIPTFSYRYFWVPLVTVLILLQYRADLLSAHDHQAEPIYPTPISEECRKGFDQIRRITSDGDMILSTKPRACALFADKHFCVMPDGEGAAAKVKKLVISKPNYILVIQEIDEDILECIARYEKDSAVYEDHKFKLYRRTL